MIASPQTSSYRATRANEKKTDDNNDDNNSNIVSTLTQHAHSPNKRACKDDYRTCIQALEFGDGRSDWKEDEDWSLDDAAEGHYKHKLHKYSYYTYYVLSLCVIIVIMVIIMIIPMILITLIIMSVFLYMQL